MRWPSYRVGEEGVLSDHHEEFFILSNDNTTFHNSRSWVVGSTVLVDPNCLFHGMLFSAKMMCVLNNSFLSEYNV